jgi:hypothetical protein
MQHSISQTSGSLAIKRSAGDSQPSSSANTAAVMRNRVKTLFLPSWFIGILLLVSSDGYLIEFVGDLVGSANLCLVLGNVNHHKDHHMPADITCKKRKPLRASSELATMKSGAS